MGVGFVENLGRSSVEDEGLERAIVVATLLGAREELTVRESTRTTLAKGVVRLRIDSCATMNLRNVTTPLANLLAPFEQYGSQPKLNEPQGSKQSCGTTTHNNHGCFAVYIGVVEVDFGGHLVAIDKDFHRKEYLRCAVAGVNGTLDNPCKSNLLAPDAEHTHSNREPPLGGGCLLGRKC